MTTNRKLTAKSFLYALPFFLIAVFIDQFSKWLVVEYLKEIRNFPIIEGVFSLHYLENRGAVFGIFYGWQAFLITFATLITAGIVYFYSIIPHDKRYRLLRVVVVLILSGAIGNLMDRIRLGFVVDFLFFELINFPVFNFADSFVVIACFLFLFLTLFYYNDEEMEFIFNVVSRKKKIMGGEEHTTGEDVSPDESNISEDIFIDERNIDVNSSVDERNTDEDSSVDKHNACENRALSEHNTDVNSSL